MALVFTSIFGTLYSQQSNWQSHFSNFLSSPSVNINKFLLARPQVNMNELINNIAAVDKLT